MRVVSRFLHLVLFQYRVIVQLLANFTLSPNSAAIIPQSLDTSRSAAISFVRKKNGISYAPLLLLIQV
jgi:hypothetical protein